MKVTSVEILKMYEFSNEHSKCCDKYGLSGIFKIKSTPSSGLGWGVDIKCTSCKTKKDITDYGAW